ncbi:glycosyl hydrolase family 8 [Sorangium cellulosum]|uniref:glycosyl hydrolase family 8 n=1 Tax=Sorangium cellulosum TaxID=56 RepID=UPI003D9AAF16
MRCPVPFRRLLGASRIGCACAALCALPACVTTVDWLGGTGANGGTGSAGGTGSTGGAGSTGGTGGAGGTGGGEGGLSSDDLRPLTGPEAYPNVLRDVLGKTDEEIAEKLEDRFNQLFYGDPYTEAIYYPVLGTTDQAFIYDVLHMDVRTEGIGFAMIITVELNKRYEFDRLWQYARTELRYTTGPNEGYLRSWCDIPSGKAPCIDPFGQQQIAMALLFAHGRWGSDTGSIDYGADALALFDVMRNKEEQNGGVVSGVTNMFDAETKLVFDIPHVAAANTTRPSIEMPAYYELWAQATGDPFWSEAAASARAYWKQVAHPRTGLMPVRADFDGTPLPGSDDFGSQAYRTPLNMALDHVWFGVDPWQVEEADRLLAFFSEQGIDDYGGAYTLEGEASTVPMSREAALIFMNGVTGLVAENEDRAAYIEAAWSMPPSTGTPRYYSGLLHLLSLLTLSGQFRVY